MKRFLYAAGTNECARETHNCSKNADCIDLPQGFACKCKDGYSGDGVTCTGINCIHIINVYVK